VYYFLEVWKAERVGIQRVHAEIGLVGGTYVNSVASGWKTRLNKIPIRLVPLPVAG
jgi:hypothetical protein